jgi:predicted transposase YdaD
VVMLLFKHIRDPDIMEKLPGIFSLMREILDSKGGLRCVEAILRYVFSTVEDITAKELKDIAEKSLSPQQGEFIMTLAEKIRDEGHREGHREGHQEGLLEAIELGLSLRFGDKSLNLMSLIKQIQDVNRLKAIKEAIKTVKGVSELRAMVEN